MKTALVILNFNGRELMRKFLPSVLAYSEDATVIVADNCSTDGSCEMLEKEFPGVQVIRIPSNLGFCGGYNYALQQVDSTYYVLLNSDVEVTPGWLSPIVHLLDHDERIAAAQPKILSWHQKTHFEYAGAAGGFVDTLGYPFCRGRLFNTLEEDRGQYDDTRPVLWASGACLVIRSDAYRALGGLDEDFFAHMEEIDLCWKLNRAGSLVYAVGESKVYHVGGGTLSKSNPRKTYFNFRNGLSLVFKHYSPAAILWKFPVRLFLDWVAAGTFLVAGSGRDALAVLRAHAHFFRDIRKDITKRKVLKRQLPHFEVSQIYRSSVVSAYFLKGHRAFSKLRF